MASKDPLYQIKKDMADKYKLQREFIDGMTELVLLGAKCECEECNCKKGLDKGDTN